MHQMLRAKCHWGLHIGMLKPTLSIRAFGDPLVRARKAGVYVDVDTKEVKEHTFDKNEWHKRYKIGRNEKGHYTGEILKR